MAYSPLEPPSTPPPSPTARIAAALAGWPALFVSAALAGSLATFAADAQAAQGCDVLQAVFVSVDGDVEVRAGETSGWQAATLGTAVCVGYTVRINEFGRAALQLPDKTVLRLDRNSTLVFREPEGDTGSLLDLVRGIIHVISRDPRALRFTTPYANAGLEGTEFVIAVADRSTEVAVIEGEVSVSNAAGALAVPEGQRAVAGPGAPPRAEPVADPFAKTRWTPYYAPILYLSLPAPDATVAAGRADDPAFLAARAASRLAVGGVEAAEADIRRALEVAPQDATALALAGLVALSRGDKAQALRDTTAAVEHAPESVAAWIALSHVQQSGFDYAAALASLERATDLEPGNAIAWAWLAELRLGNDDSRGALAAANRAASLDAGLARVQTILGFVYLEHSSAERASAAFERAVALDQEDPLPRIGRALALVRQGRLAEGREQAETAVILDPLNSQIRSYMAKIYAEENRLELTESQLRIARTLDPSDATPYYYDAINRHGENSPIEALQSLNTAIELNGNRPVFRSSLRVDEDLAVRSYGLGELHKDLGFGNLALLEGWKATLDAPGDHSGHRLLADLYSTLPRHEIARVNELYKAQLLQPLNVTPVPAQLAEANLFILQSVGPSELAFTEYGPLVRRNGLSLLGSAVTAGNGTDGVSASVAGVGDRVSYSTGHFAFETDGFRPNNDLDQQVTNAFVQFRPSDVTSLQAELRSTDTDKGDLRMLFDPAAYNALLRQDEHVDSLRLGMRHALSPRSTLLATAIFEDQQFDLTSGPGIAFLSERSGTTVDIQHHYQLARGQLITGVRHLDQDEDRSSHLVLDLPFPPFQTVVDERRRSGVSHSSAYAYANVAIAEKVTATLGAAADRVEAPTTRASQISPKLGLLFEPTSRTAVRATALQTLEGPLLSRYSIQPRLEPTHVMGFNQLFFGSQGEETSRVGIAIDHEFSARLFAGAEVSDRAVRSEVIKVQPDLSTMLEATDRDESLVRGYIYWAATLRSAFAAEYQYERVDGNGDVLTDGIERLRTQRLPISLNLFNDRNMHAGIKATYVDQEGLFSPFSDPANPVVEPGSDSFWVLDLSLSYRLPRRRGSVSLSVHNALDEEFGFQDMDPENQSIMPERMLALRFTLSY